MKVITSWSGGKDSCLALHKALSQGLEVKALVNFISEVNKKSSFHKIDSQLMKLQAECIGIPIFQKEVPPNMEGYKDAFMDAVNLLKKEQGIKGMVFGDIALQEHLDWVTNTCNELQIETIEPLWGIDTKQVACEFINKGFKSVIVNLKRDLLGSEWVGRMFDFDFVNHCESKNVDVCGENGEFHTFVVDGPLFTKRIDVLESKVKILDEDPFNNAYLDILKYKAISKEAAEWIESKKL